MINKTIRFLLKRKVFIGQFRIFSWFYQHKCLKYIKTVSTPITGQFKINLNTKNFIDACIYYMGDYEPYLKIQFKQLIKTGDVVLDIGANIGFHSFYFAELVGQYGKVIAFEPIVINYDTLQKNLNLNKFSQIIPINKALGNVNATMDIHIDSNVKNPGAFNLMEEGIKNTKIECIKGDDYLEENKIKQINLIKIDVEGYELEVLKGLKKSILMFNPIIIFEYDRIYQSKLNNDPIEIFDFLGKYSYQFFKIDKHGKRVELNLNHKLHNAEILALPPINYP